MTPVDEELTQLATRLSEYRIAGKNRRTVGHLRRLVEAVGATRTSRGPGKRNLGQCYEFLGQGISTTSVNR